MVVIHSQLTDRERALAWHAANSGVARLVIGTRSAIFTPMPALGLIVVDEEHDASFKQLEGGVRYSARDTALVRARMANIPLILGSATPSLESLYNSSINKYTRLCLTHKALSSTLLHYKILDLRNKAVEHGIAAPTLQLIKEHVAQGNQALIFINRRGFAPVFLCHQCGWMAECRACDSHLTWHQQRGELICHHCGAVSRVITSCPKCNSRHFVPVGVGTQRVHAYLQEQIPMAEVVRIDRDEMRNKQIFDATLQRIITGKVNIMIGTQMLAKGHHFPRVTLVVVLDADAGFYNQDFRALERLGQLLTQVAGRAGRAELPGQVVIQTYMPDHPLLNILVRAGYANFAQELLTSRAQAQLPPFAFLALIRAQGKQQEKVARFLQLAKAHLVESHSDVFGPAPAPMARKAGHHRMQLLVRAASRRQLGALLTRLRHVLSQDKLSANIRWHIDVDPADLS